ncbi:CDP-diacylglycerol--glycerol-3-phosphate 3-phosphatidyltransferase [Minicystis rosea]|nr:CDP-diacylglycerol--glycerol-3-phosphate 3-phosphatidyltransferase [Minicystis rosea]
MTDVDLGCSLLLLSIVVVAGIAYAIRVAIAGAVRNARVDAVGPSPLLSKSVMEMAYWVLDPVARACVRVGLSANGVTAIALAIGAFAGVALALGHFGVAALATTVASLGDAIDGLVARKTGTVSKSGALFDASVDRYEEFFFFAGLAFWYHTDHLGLGLVLAAVLGSFMISYGSAKAEGFQVKPPRGAMRREARAVYLGAGAFLTPLAAALASRVGVAWIANAPMLGALAFVGVIANVSAVRRLRLVGAAADEKAAANAAEEAAKTAGSETASDASAVDPANEADPDADQNAQTQASPAGLPSRALGKSTRGAPTQRPRDIVGP